MPPLFEDTSEATLHKADLGSAKLCAHPPCAEVVIRAVPPNARPVPGKRRPRPSSLSGRSVCASDAPCAQSARAPSEELARLHRCVLELSLKCEKQGAELEELRRGAAQPQVGGNADHATTATHSASSTASLAVGVQTDTASSDRATGDMKEQQEHWDSVHREAGEKGRELRKVQDTVRLLRVELQHQCEVAAQFKVQTEALQEQLTKALLQRRQAEAEASASRFSTPRPRAEVMRRESPRTGATRAPAQSSDEEEEEEDADTWARSRHRVLIQRDSSSHRLTLP